MDKYGQRYLTRILHQEGRAENLYELVVDPRWYQESVDNDPSGSFFANDLQLAFDSSMKSGAKGLPRLAGLSLLFTESTTTYLAIFPLAGLECLLRMNPDLAELVEESLLKASIDTLSDVEAYFGVVSVLSALRVQAAHTAVDHILLRASHLGEVKRIHVRSRAGEILARTGRDREAKALLDSIAATAGAIEGGFGVGMRGAIDEEIAVLIAIARLTAQVGKVEVAAKLLEIATKRKDRAISVDEDGEGAQADILLEIGIGFYYAGQLNDSVQYLDVASKTIIAQAHTRWYSRDPKRIHRLARLIRGWLLLGMSRKALELEPLLLKVTHEYSDAYLEDEEDKISVLFSAALVESCLGNDRKATILISKAHEHLTVAYNQTMFGTDSPGQVLKKGLLLYPAATWKMRWSLLKTGAYFQKDLVRDPKTILDDPLYRPAFGLSNIDEEIESKIKMFALCDLAKGLAAAGAQQEACDVFCGVLHEASVLQNAESALTHAASFVKGAGRTKSGFRYVWVLNSMLETQDRALVDSAISIILPDRSIASSSIQPATDTDVISRPCLGSVDI